MKWMFFLSAVFICNWTHSQHCGYDFTGILLVDIQDRTTGLTINGLNVYLIDGSGKPVMSEFQSDETNDQDTLLFYHHSIPENDNKSQFHYKAIWFIGESYALAIDRNTDISKYQIVIEDRDGELNGSYSSKKIRLYQLLNFPLCTDASNWDHVEDRKDIEGLHVLSVRI